MALLITTVGKMGLSGSDTRACSGWLSIGSRTSAILASMLLWPAATSATFLVLIAPRLVSMPTTAPFSRRIPTTSQFWMMSTPSASAARAKPQATASWRATPARRWKEAPSTGSRVLRLMKGTISWIWAGVSTSASTPLRRLAPTRRSMSRISCSVCPRFITPRWLNMTL